ncbi:heme oxygenase-domain-containing protein [Zychaea mexicana]|uniref:heme oxygenase-domain-containing protein n=1 Tax=Zychaea mexicana TaxID=64656 RepID=UPI0022FE30D5|nr:heme oxygenase-domain-containing protein [Zychaea mexicana]KAI9493357.1 heme oxygenase-domain-containing protein [Zychaea mexicana]
MTETTITPPSFPHPGLDHLANTEELRSQCPAFAAGCPYAKVDNHVISGFGELSKCPAFQEGCPFSNKNKEEIRSLFSNMPKEHPNIDMQTTAESPEGAILVQMLNQIVSDTAMGKVASTGDEAAVTSAEPTTPAPAPLKKDVESEIMEDPQLAAAMREGTMAAHKAAENSVFTKRFLKGEINRDEYGRYITSLYFVYKSMESLLEKHKDNLAIKTIYFPVELNRVHALLQDLEFYYGKDKVSQVTDPATMTPAVKEYVEAMELACEVNPALLVAHSYSRYLGDLSGGQILAKRLKKHILGLSEGDGDWDSDEGLHFYDFANIGNQSAFKNEYRERLNRAPVDKRTRDLIVTEAIRSFEVNIAVFDEIQQLSEQDKLVPTLGSEKKSAGSTLARWSPAIALSVAAAAIGTAYYVRFYQRK